MFSSQSLPHTPPDLNVPEPQVALSQDDLSLLEYLTAPSPPSAKFQPRSAHIEPLLLATAASSGPHVTRHHYHHEFFPNPLVSHGRRASRDRVDSSDHHDLSPITESPPSRALTLEIDSSGSSSLAATPSLSPASSPNSSSHDLLSGLTAVGLNSLQVHGKFQNDVDVKCMARTRVPTPHGPVFLHIYHNNRDNKEHLAIVVDPAQWSEDDDDSIKIPSIRSKSLDSVWSSEETEMDRLTRGAYVGRLSETTKRASTPDQFDSHVHSDEYTIPLPLVRIHSECFTGETIGSMRCDCGEQLDEAIRRISQPMAITNNKTKETRMIPGRGAVIYMRQEGRGIGLLSKIRAYNLQDMGYDTVSANLALGHLADERGYDVAAAIMRDLNLAGDDSAGVRLLTNNPDKVEKLTNEHVHVVERVPMVPRTWQVHDETDGVDHHREFVSTGIEPERTAGATLIGGGVTQGADLERYLRTKVLRMGHMLSLPEF